MIDKIIKIADYNKNFNKFLPIPLEYNAIYQSIGLEIHVSKRHPDCVEYMDTLPHIIAHPDYIGVNPRETNTSFELVKTFDRNIRIGIKLDMKDDYLYVATLYAITDAKLAHDVKNGRLKKFDK